jgi:flagellar assembly factor FliW
MSGTRPAVAEKDSAARRNFLSALFLHPALVTAASPAPSERPAVTISSALLGAITVTPASVFDIPGGLRGFESLQSFALVPAMREGLFWLQSLDAPDCVFLLGDPFAVSTEFTVDLNDTDRAQLGLVEAAEALVLGVITLPALGRAPFDQPTMNLRGPVVFNTTRGVARQVVFAAEGFEFRAPVALDQYPHRSTGGVAPVGGE